MHTFTDNCSRTWSVILNVDALKRVRALASVNLMEAVEGTLLEKLSHDPVLLCDVLFACVKPEADAKSISDTDFGKGLAGDALELATAALLEELVDFFPEARRRLLGKALGKLRKWQAKVLQVAEARLESPAFDLALEAKLNATTDSLGNLAASPG
jgi:hypothetical protein